MFSNKIIPIYELWCFSTWIDGWTLFVQIFPLNFIFIFRFELWWVLSNIHLHYVRLMVMTMNGLKVGMGVEWKVLWKSSGGPVTTTNGNLCKAWNKWNSRSLEIFRYEKFFLLFHQRTGLKSPWNLKMFIKIVAVLQTVMKAWVNDSRCCFKQAFSAIYQKFWNKLHKVEVMFD